MSSNTNTSQIIELLDDDSDEDKDLRPVKDPDDIGILMNPLPVVDRNNMGILMNPSGLVFHINQAPTPLSRPRFNNGGIGNTNKKAMKSVRESLKNGIPNFCPIPRSVPLSVRITLFLKRPKNNFINGQPGPGRLKDPSAKYFDKPKGGDLDNYAKFYLDAMNEVVYSDDQQVVNLKVSKIPDNKGNCTGRVEICVRKRW
jgi:Holliday junction resolvase RusA-like endonuclease